MNENFGIILAGKTVAQRIQIPLDLGILYSFIIFHFNEFFHLLYNVTWDSFYCISNSIKF